MVAAAGSATGASAVANKSAVVSEDSGVVDKEPTISDGRRGRFFNIFNLLGLTNPVVEPDVQKPIHITPVVILKPAAPYPGSGGCRTDSQCSGGYHCAAHRCVQCSTDQHCNPGGRLARSFQKRCERNRCVDHWVADVVRCTRYTPCPSGQYCSGGVCRPLVAVGEPCSVAESCRSNSCLQGKCAECSQWAPCGHGQFCDHGRCKHPGGQGESCWLSFQCKSHICWHGSCAECAHSSDCSPHREYCEQGECRPLGSFGERCYDNSQCSSNICDANTQKCVACKNSAACADGSYCSVDQKCVPKGVFQDRCIYDNHCLSNKCSAKNRCVQCTSLQDCDSSTQFCDVAGDGTCKMLGQVGQSCELNEQCHSPLTCNHITGKCVQCQSSTQCNEHSERCDSVLGMCVPKSPLGDPCVGDDDCLSDVCENLSHTCVQCRIGFNRIGGLPGDCAPTEPPCTDQAGCPPTGIPDGLGCPGLLCIPQPEPIPDLELTPDGGAEAGVGAGAGAGAGTDPTFIDPTQILGSS